MFAIQNIKLFLRLALSFSFLSAVADRFGLWPAQISVWGNWENFIAYTQVINPWLPEALVSPAARGSHCSRGNFSRVFAGRI